MPTYSSYLAVFFVVALVTVGDYYLKLAGDGPTPFRSRAFWIGFALYAVTAFLWVGILGRFKLATVGAVYGAATVICLASVGVLVFHERLAWQELGGIALAVAALVLLSRFQ